MELISSVKCSLSWLLIMILTLQFRCCRSCFDADRTSLLELKAYFKSASAGDYADDVLDSWPDDIKSDCCRWLRIKCDDTTGRVVQLALNNVAGSSKHPLLNLSLLHPFEELRSLDLSGNYFGGLFDGIEGYSSFMRFKKLETLDLNSNPLNNSILPYLRAATSLKILKLGKTDIEGLMPLKDLVNLRELEILDLSGIGLNGSLDDPGICEMKNLRELDLSYNDFTGHPPDCMRNMTRLRTLDVSFNHLSGKLPSVISHMTSLEYLSLLGNDFEGSFAFSSLANLSNLKVFRLSSKVGSLEVNAESSWQPWFQLKALDLQNCSLNGSIPGFLLHQRDLRFLELSNNKIAGTFPSWLLRNNSKLEVLYLNNNSITGLTLPEGTHTLLHLDVSNNKIDGSLPETIGILFPKMKCLDLSRNKFYGTIPFSMGEMKNLLTLDLSHNNLSGELPRNLVSSHNSLSFLRLSNNNFEGKIFPDYANLTNLQWLLVNDNKFTGSIGKGLLNSVSLRVLNISNNMISGEIPDWIGRFGNLMHISMGKNRLGGGIPGQLINLTYLEVLDLSENRLSGSIPSSFNLSKLGTLHLQNNGLVGSIPDALFASKDLVALDLRNNKFSGSIPKSVGKLSKLGVLLLRGNRIQGRIPEEICQLRQVNFLDLSHNRLHGSMPSCLNKMSFGMAEEGESKSPFSISEIIRYPRTLGTLYQYRSAFELPLAHVVYFQMDNYKIQVDFTAKRRYESFEGDTLFYMFGLDISSNKLTGPIPTQIGCLQKLRALNLSFNYFSGSIPKSFSNLTNIEGLDLSYNELQGRIPLQLVELYALAVFNVSYNNLSGPIPYKSQFATFDESSYKRNPNLCGPPTNKSCNDNEVPTQVTSPPGEEDESSDIDMVWFYWSFGASYVVALLGICVFLCIDTHWSRAWFCHVDVCIYHLRRLNVRLKERMSRRRS